jgi:glycosyltransferase involved in cell wall biosynthesis
MFGDADSGVQNTQVNVRGAGVGAAVENRAAGGLALVFDAPDEGWVSMQRVGEELERALRSAGEPVARLQWPLPRLARAASPARLALNVDRALGRFGAYPLQLLPALREQRLFHVVDHSYSHLLWVLPPERTGVFCHDLDAYRAALPGTRERAEPWRRAMANVQLAGLRRAAVVFTSTEVTASELVALAGVPRERLVVAPYGTGPEYTPEGPDAPELAPVRAALGGQPYVLHVGSGAPRKRLDRLKDVHARLRNDFPRLLLLQHGAPMEALPADGSAGIVRTGGPLSPSAIAALYRGASMVLQTSDAEGFGLPVLEALACGVPVVASDLPTVREVGGEHVDYVPREELEAWARAAAPHLREGSTAEARRRRAAWAARFSWEAQARVVQQAYRQVAEAAA